MLIALGAALLLVMVLYVAWGTVMISPVQALREMFAGPTGSPLNNILWQIRLPRAIGTLCVGALLSTVGCAFQGLLRNPLADPFVVGVSSGSALGGVAAMLLGWSYALGGLAMPLVGFAGGMLALLLALAFSRSNGSVDVKNLLLAGVATGSLLSALLSLSLLWSGHDTNELLQWLLGDTSHLRWSQVGLLAVVLVIGAILLIRQSRVLNAFALGEETAMRLGVDTRKLKPLVFVTGAAMTAVAVSLVGIIGFVGLVAPHIARRLVGTDWRRSLPASTLVGGLLLLLADLLAQRLVQPLELPLGVVTAIAGAPVLLVLLRKP